MNPEAVVEKMWEERAAAILRTNDQQVAHDAMDAAVRGGFRVIEFTLGCSGPFELIEEFAKRDDLVVGAGTVLTVDDARRAVEAGARFIVSPVVDSAVIREAANMGAAAMPGTHTPTEMLQAHCAGAQLQKLFPCPAGGPSYVKATLGPLPFLRIVPTNGVDAGNVGDWIRSRRVGRRLRGHPVHAGGHRQSGLRRDRTERARVTRSRARRGAAGTNHGAGPVRARDGLGVGHGLAGHHSALHLPPPRLNQTPHTFTTAC